MGYRGLRCNVDGRIRGGMKRGKVSFYYDDLPTNCVAERVCAGYIPAENSKKPLV